MKQSHRASRAAIVLAVVLALGSATACAYAASGPAATGTPAATRTPRSEELNTVQATTAPPALVRRPR